MQTFEIYFTAQHITSENWRQINNALAEHLGFVSRYEIVIVIHENIVRYYIRCMSNISVLASGLDGVLFRPIEDHSITPPHYESRSPNMSLKGVASILELREKHILKRNLSLDYVSFTVWNMRGLLVFTTIDTYYRDTTGSWSAARRFSTSLPIDLLNMDFTGSNRYRKRAIPTYLGVSKSLHMMSTDSTNALFTVDPFPLLSSERYIPLTSYEFDKHSLIVGASGSGKSKLISLYVDRLRATLLHMNYRVIVIDPHANLAHDFAHICDSEIVSFGTSSGADLFPGAGTDISSAVELTATLFKSILADQFNPRLDRLIRYSLFSLMTAQIMSLPTLKRFVTDAEYRNNVMRHVEQYIPDNVYKFFGTDFNELRTQYYETTIMPIVSMVDEMQLQPSLASNSNVSLKHLISENFLTVFSLNKVSMGDKVVRTVAGLLIQQIFLLAQSRAFDQKVVLIIDEVSVVQNPAIAQILAEARKFNLHIILTQQYFGQVEKGLRDAIFSNVSNYYVFKVSEEDALQLAGNLSMELPSKLVESEKAKGVDQTQLKARIMTELSPRECLLRVMTKGQLSQCIKVQTIDAPDNSTHTPPLIKEYQQLPAKYIDPPDTPDVEHSTPVVHNLSVPPPGTASLHDLMQSQSGGRKHNEEME